MNLPRAPTNFYIQEYRYITFNTKLGKIRTLGKNSTMNPNFESFEAQNDNFFILFGKNHTNLRKKRNENFSPSTIPTIFQVKK